MQCDLGGDDYSGTGAGCLDRVYGGTDDLVGMIQDYGALVG